MKEICFVQNFETSQQKTPPSSQLMAYPTPKFEYVNTISIAFLTIFHGFLRELHLICLVMCIFFGRLKKPYIRDSSQGSTVPGLESYHGGLAQRFLCLCWGPSVSEVVKRRQRVTCGFFYGKIWRYTLQTNMFGWKITIFNMEIDLQMVLFLLSCGFSRV